MNLKKHEKFSAGTNPPPGLFKTFFQECSRASWVLVNYCRLKQLWPPLFLELSLALSMSVAYYYLIRPYAVGVPNNSTNLYVNSAFSIANYHAQLFDNLVIAGRLAGMLILGYLSDFSFHNSSLNVEQYSTYFALYHSLWLFFLFVVIILALRHSLLVNLGVFAGLIYSFSPAAGGYFYPWDVPATLFFTLGILFYERRQILQMILVMCIGCIFKETVLVCALLLLLFFDEWKWRKRFLTFAGVLLFYVLAKKILTTNLHIKVASFSMDNAKSIGELLRPRILIENLKFISTPTFNNVFFANAGTIIGVLVLGWQRRFLPYMLVILAFLACQSMWGSFNEFRIFMQILPLCVIILAQRWQDYTFPATAVQTQPLSKPPSKIQGLKNAFSKPIARLRPWSVRETFPILTWLAVLLCGISIAIAGWQYYSIIEYQKPDYQTHIIEDLKLKAENNDAQAQLQLALHYAQGQGTAKDIAASIPWFRKAADQGNVDAQCNLGLLYENGIGVNQDLAEAAQWFHKAADQGNALAEYNLALFFQRGLAYQQDLNEAYLWYSRSAKQGYAPAQLALGKIYHEGQGVKADNPEAYKWFKLAQMQGLPDALNELTNCATTMSKEQVNAAEEAVRQLQNGHQ